MEQDVRTLKKSSEGKRSGIGIRLSELIDKWSS